ncbi:Abi family protein [Nocardia neocaledoniensis]|uniref:Abi family protein n=1 Tax=Nocardia neocaledoniensis TaxID=236511 RepID=UPI0024584EE4|nr:Abi family protein [Nocardia neocaledoniensis]
MAKNHGISDAQLRAWISVERLTKYDAVREDSVDLYHWNAELSAAFFELIGHVEVLLRNVIHAKLEPHTSGGAWYDDPHYRFSTDSRREIDKAKRRAGSGGRPATPGRVVSQLTFGFWRYLLASNYKTTIWPRVSPGFTGVPRHERKREELEAAAARVLALRNRVAHHEPIFDENSARHFADLVFIASYVDRDAVHWLWRISPIHQLMQSRPCP